jgi:hypothetical protein
MRRAISEMRDDNPRGRGRRDEEGDFVFPRIVLSIDDVISLAHDTITIAETLSVPDETELADVRLDAERLIALAFETAPGAVLDALMQVLDGATMTDAAANLGMSRFAIRRAIDAWVK